MEENTYKSAFDELLNAHKRYSAFADIELLRQAFDFSYNAHKDQLRKSGVPYFEHCFEVAKILTDLKMDSTTIAGGFLHDVAEDTGVSIEEVEEKREQLRDAFTECQQGRCSCPTKPNASAKSARSSSAFNFDFP